MPIPLVVAAIPSIIIWARNALAAGGLIGLVSSNSVEELWVMLKALIVEEVARVAGLNLDPDNPFSDASLAGAVGQKVGIPFRSFKDQAMIREDLDNFAADLVSQRSGYVVRSVSNVAMLKEDLLQIAGAEMTGRLGIPLGVMPGAGQAFDAGAVREQLLIWAKAELMNSAGAEIGLNVDDIIGAGGLVAVVEQLNGQLAALGSHENITARQLAVRVANQMAVDAIGDLNKMALAGSKKGRRRASLRAAQQKFRAVHGNRQVYVPLGMSASVS